MSGANIIGITRNPSSNDTPERVTRYGAGPETKGGGYRSGPKRWTGRGPAPARHIPWPEIFRHHISLVEGHLKMIDMVRKHTVEGTRSWEMICQAIDRAKEMLSTSKYIARTFVPPPRQRERVPLGSSSASMYPGYSPADHEYGMAAKEFGRFAAEAKQRGEEIQIPGVEYNVGQAKGLKRKTSAGMREALAKKNEGDGIRSGSGSNAPALSSTNGNPSIKSNVGEEQKASGASEDVVDGNNPYFIIDTKPMKVDLPGVQSSKRGTTPPDAIESKKHKKAKKTHDGALPAGEGFEDISAEVDAKLKEKEEKRKRKEEKKRKRESDGTPIAAPVNNTADTVETEKPPKKKKKKQQSAEAVAIAKDNDKKRASESQDEARKGETEKPKKRKSKPLKDKELSANGTMKKRNREESSDADGGEAKKRKERKVVNDSEA